MFEREETTMTDNNTIVMNENPPCDFCRFQNTPQNLNVQMYDVKTLYGWGYACQSHFDRFGCTLGLGKGQRIVVASGKSVT